MQETIPYFGLNNMGKDKICFGKAANDVRFFTKQEMKIVEVSLGNFYNFFGRAPVGQAIHFTSRRCALVVFVSILHADGVISRSINVIQ